MWCGPRIAACRMFDSRRKPISSRAFGVRYGVEIELGVRGRVADPAVRREEGEEAPVQAGAGCLDVRRGGAGGDGGELHVRRVLGLQLRGPSGREATLRVADHRGGAVGRQLLRMQLASGPHRVEHVRSERAPDHVDVVSRGPEAFVVRDRDAPAARQQHRHQPGLKVEAAGKQARRRGAVADAVRPDRVPDQRPRSAPPAGRQQHGARHRTRLAER